MRGIKLNDGRVVSIACLALTILGWLHTSKRFLDNFFRNFLFQLDRQFEVHLSWKNLQHFVVHATINRKLVECRFIKGNICSKTAKVIQFNFTLISWQTQYVEKWKLCFGLYNCLIPRFCQPLICPIFLKFRKSNSIYVKEQKTCLNMCFTACLIPLIFQ